MLSENLDIKKKKIFLGGFYVSKVLNRLEVRMVVIFGRR